MIRDAFHRGRVQRPREQATRDHYGNLNMPLLKWPEVHTDINDKGIPRETVYTKECHISNEAKLEMFSKLNLMIRKFANNTLSVIHRIVVLQYVNDVIII